MLNCLIKTNNIKYGNRLLKKLKKVSIRKLCTNKSSEIKKTSGWKTLKIDRSELINFDLLPENNGNVSQKEEKFVPKENLTALAKDLQSYIQLRGPITLHDYIFQSSNHFLHGYYQNKLPKIGQQGNFVTAPEISQLFGEVITVWCYLMWQNLSSPSKIRIAELGPGNGTLMKDIIQTASSFPKFKESICSVHLVELSETMRQIQKNKLDNPSSSSKNNIPIYWHSYIQDVPVEPDIPILFIAQEFLDAFPVHQLVKVGSQWREKLIDIDTSPTSPYHFRVVLSPTETPASKVYIPEFQVTSYEC
jgi:SAM-dependent MidA family methyltransferase